MKFLIDLGRAVYARFPKLYYALPFVEALNSNWYRRVYIKRIDKKRKEYFLGGFDEVVFELTNKCNADCIMCPNGVMEREVSYMSGELFEKIVDQMTAARFPVKLFVFSGLGEPTLDPQLVERIKYIKAKGPYKVKLITNGSLLVAHKSKALIDAGLDEVMISFNGFSKESYEAVMRHLSFDKTLENVMTFLGAREGGRPRVTVSCVQLDANAKDLATMEEFWRSRGVHINEFKKPIPINRGGEAIQFKSRWAMSKDDRHLWPCRSMAGTMIINSDGNVALCCMDYESMYPMGNFKTEPLQQIMKRKGEIYEAHLRKDFSMTPMCLNCTIMNQQALAWWSDAV